jgi:protein ImuA
MSAALDLAALRRKLAATAGIASGVSTFSLGAASLDAAFAQGLARGALHEIHARSCGDGTAATAFGLGLALRAANERPTVWIRQTVIDIEMGGLNGEGLSEFGLDPGRLILVRLPDARDVLRAGEEAARCSALGAVVIEPWGAPKALDLTATRRLALAAEHSGVALVMVRSGAAPMPSAALTRWDIASAPSAPLEANAPGGPVFAVTLAKARSARAGGSWIVEWDRDQQQFKDAQTVSGAVASMSFDGSLPESQWRNAG